MRRAELDVFVKPIKHDVSTRRRTAATLISHDETLGHYVIVSSTESSIPPEHGISRLRRTV
jgi:hypothetical protein